MNYLVVTLACLVTLCGCTGGDKQSDNALVRFEGGVITREDVVAHYENMKKKSQFREKPELLTPEFVFDHALNMEMIIAKGLDENLHRDPRVREILHDHMSDLFLKIMEEKLITPIDRSAITDDEMRQYYEQHKEQYQEKAKYILSAFTVASEQAVEAATALKAGELDFTAAAAKYALEEEARKNGGKTGSRTLRRFQPSWQPVVEKLEVGVVAGPVELDGKTWMLRLERKTEPHQYSFEEKKEYIRNDVLYSRYRDQWQQVYDGLKKQFKVAVDQPKLDAFYKEFNPAGKPAQSEPAVAPADKGAGSTQGGGRS